MQGEVAGGVAGLGICHVASSIRRGHSLTGEAVGCRRGVVDQPPQHGVELGEHEVRDLGGAAGNDRHRPDGRGQVLKDGRHADGVGAGPQAKGVIAGIAAARGVRHGAGGVGGGDHDPGQWLGRRGIVAQPPGEADGVGGEREVDAAAHDAGHDDRGLRGRGSVRGKGGRGDRVGPWQQAERIAPVGRRGGRVGDGARAVGGGDHDACNRQGGVVDAAAGDGDGDRDVAEVDPADHRTGGDRDRLHRRQHVVGQGSGPDRVGAGLQAKLVRPVGAAGRTRGDLARPVRGRDRQAAELVRRRRSVVDQVAGHGQRRGVDEVDLADRAGGDGERLRIDAGGQHQGVEGVRHLHRVGACLQLRVTV